MFHPAKLVAALFLIALAGCATGPGGTHGKNRPPDVDLTEAAPTQRIVEPKPALTPPPTNLPPQNLSVPPETWIPLARWAKVNHLGSLTNLRSNPLPTFALPTPTGAFVVRAGSVLAQWAGLELRLGFKPQLIGKEPFIHRLDLQKNLIPLLANAPGPTPGPHVIVLDPGHGGHDSGTCSAAGNLEKDYTLDWAMRLADLLTHAGWQVFLTRTNDVDVSLPDRVAFADAHHADLFLSLHFNAATGSSQSGIETYCLTPTGMPSNLTRGYEDNPVLVFPNNQFDAQNVQLALRLHRALLDATGTTDRGVRRARFLAVLRGQHCPAVLIEGGYLSNPAEAALIDTPEHRQKLATAVAKALE